MNTMATISPAPDPAFRHDVVTVVVIATAYFLAHQLAFFFPDSGKILMLVWPAGGIGLAAFLLNPRRLWPALTLALYGAGILADLLLAHRPLLTSVGYMTANMVESICCAWLILGLAGEFKGFNQIREVQALILGAIFINAISASIGAATSALTQGGSFSGSWVSWYIADGLGLLLVGPFVVSWFGRQGACSRLPAKRVMEGILFAGVWLFVLWGVFYPEPNPSHLDLHPYALVAVLVWPAMRLGLRGVTLALMLLFVVAIISPAMYSGPSPWPGLDSDATSRMLELQKFLGIMASVGFLLSAVHTELAHAQGLVREANEELRDAVARAHGEKAKTEAIIAAMGDGVNIQDTNYTILYQNRVAKEIYGDHAGEHCYQAFQNRTSVCGQCHLAMAFTDGMVHTVEQKRSTGQGVRHYEITSSPVKDAGGKIIAGVELVRDVTDRKRAEEQLQRALEEKTVMLKEIHHRVKNNLTVVYSLLALQAKGIADAAVRAKFEESRNRVLSMALIHEKLYRAEDLAHVDFKEYLQSLASTIGDTYHRPDILLSVDMEPLFLDVNVGIPCGLIANELITNALKYAFPEGRGGTIRVGIRASGEGNLLLFVEDNGVGFPEDIDYLHTSSLGLQLVNSLAGQIHGQLVLARQGGSCFQVPFPGGGRAEGTG